MPQFPTRWPITKDECDALDRAFGALPLPRAPDASYYPSDEALEGAIERLVDRADALFLAGRATQEQYDAWMRELNRWSETKQNASADRDFGQAERLEDNSRHPASA